MKISQAVLPNAIDKYLHLSVVFLPVWQYNKEREVPFVP